MLLMQTEDSEIKSSIIETPNGSMVTDKSLKNLNKISQRVDINVLKSRLKEKENIILKKNILIIISCLTLVIAAGISVTYL
tara:strand:+ start:288 stop:530 length:243 start_codon:yes stop_codon:yes gene_type:complete